MAPVQNAEFWTGVVPPSFQETCFFLVPRIWIEIIILLKFAVMEKTGLIRSLKELINIIWTALNNKTCHSIPPTALQQAVNPCFPIHSVSKLFGSARSVSICNKGEVWQRVLSQLPPLHTLVFSLVDCSELSDCVFLGIRTVGSLRTRLTFNIILNLNARSWNFL